MTGPIPYDEISRHLRVLAAPGRLELLRKLQVPRSIGEIDIAASRPDRERTAGRPLSRATVAAHVRRLEAAGLVQARAATRDGEPATEYVVQPARLFVLLDELRKITLLRPRETGDTVASESSAVPPPALPAGPALVMVNGPSEGIVYALAGDGPWLVGRELRVDVPLPHDPFVSRQHARIRRIRGALAIEPASAEPERTSVNWRPLSGPEPVRLAAGDVLGVGRSLLVVRGGPA